MKVLFTFVFLLITKFCSAGNVIDTVALRVHYHSYYKARIEDESLYDDDHILDIGNHASKFYSRRFTEFVMKKDSLRKSGAGFDAMTRFSIDMFGSKHGTVYDVYKNYPSDGRLVFTDMLYEKYFYYCEEDIPSIEWELADADTTIIGYQCKKAVGTLRGRKWTVWYAMDIPYSEGPWKLCGLPGLIMSAHESEGIFSFDCIGLEMNTNGNTISFNKRKYQKCTPKEYQEIQKEYWRDQLNFVQRMEGRPYVTPGSYQKVFTPCFMDFY